MIPFLDYFSEFELANKRAMRSTYEKFFEKKK